MIHKTIISKETLSLENSFGVITTEDVEILIELSIDGEQGWFELYDVPTAGEDWYAEGTLYFEGKTLTDYDGVFSLPLCLIRELQKEGYNVQEFEN